MKCIAIPLFMTLSLALPVQADEADLQKRADELSAELEKLKQEMKELDSRTEALADQQQSTGLADSLASAYKNSGVSIWGYGEINYNRPDDSSNTKMDLRRAVFGFGYEFDDSTNFISEFEVEHGVVSADDDGEFEVEQFYIDHSLTDSVSVKGGLFLIPSGILNISHEPVYYYGVERNFVETAIIPTTWREGGAGVYGLTEQGIAWDVGVTTGFNLASWDPASTEGQESPLGSIHQELQNANAKDLAVYTALEYRGIPGFVVGGSVFTGKAGQGQSSVELARNSRVTLWEAHTQWAPGNFDLAALYAMGTISDTGALNATFVGNPSLIPEEFWGGYVRAAYRIPLPKARTLAPFVRFSQYNTGAEYDVDSAFSANSLPTETVWTTGVNFYLNPHVVLKADYQNFDKNGDNDRFDLGLGLDF